MDAKWLKQYLNCFGDQTWKIFLGALCQLRYGLALAVCQGVGFDIGDDVTLEHALPDLKDKVGAWVSGDTNLKVLTEEAVFLMKELTYPGSGLNRDTFQNPVKSVLYTAPDHLTSFDSLLRSRLSSLKP